PTTFTPCSYSLPATPSVSSPPIAIIASTPSAARFSLIRSMPVLPSSVAWSESGFVRDEPSTVPPLGRMPRTAGPSSGWVSATGGGGGGARRARRRRRTTPPNAPSGEKVPSPALGQVAAYRPAPPPPPVPPPRRVGAPFPRCAPPRPPPATLVPMSVLAIDAG